MIAYLVMAAIIIGAILLTVAGIGMLAVYVPNLGDLAGGVFLLVLAAAILSWRHYVPAAHRYDARAKVTRAADKAEKAQADYEAVSLELLDRFSKACEDGIDTARCKAANATFDLWVAEHGEEMTPSQLHRVFLAAARAYGAAREALSVGTINADVQLAIAEGTLERAAVAWVASLTDDDRTRIGGAR